MKRILRKTMGMFLLFLALSMLQSAAVFWSQLLMKEGIDRAGLGEGFTTPFLLFAVLAVGAQASYFISDFVFYRYLERTNFHLKEWFTRQMFAKDIHALQSENSHSYISAYTNDLNTIEQNELLARKQMTEFGFQLLVGLTIVILVNPWMLLVAIGGALIQMFFTSLFGGRIEREQKRKSELFEKYTNYIKEVLSAFHIIKGAGIESKVRADFSARARDVQEQNYRIDRTITLTSSVQAGGMQVSMLLISAAAGWFVIQGMLSIGGLILLLMAFGRVMWPMQALAEVFAQRKKAKAAFAHIEELLRHDAVEEAAQTAARFDRALSLQSVDFAYDAAKPIFVSANVRFDKGGKYLVVGPSGGGKSTLLRLLRRYIDPQQGAVMLDDRDLRGIDRLSYFRLFSYIEQQVFVFEDTVRNNLTLYQEYSDGEIERAIDLAGLRSFVESNPEGLEYKVLDGGKNISGGERSRLAIARALLTNSDLILLDEAFASLDAEVARRIESTLLSLEGVTVIHVSHVVFEETKAQFDRIYTVANGSIAVS